MTLSTPLFQTRFARAVTATALLTGLSLGSLPPSAQAGCGCTKAPPAPAAVRPHATYAGMDVTLFHANLQSDSNYAITFTSGTTGQQEIVYADAVTQRDLADGQDKSQLVVTLPNLPLGPTAVSVQQLGQSGTLLDLDDSALTVAPQPFSLPTQIGETVMANYQAAVGRDGTVYVSLDLTGTTLPRTFRVQAEGYPLRFTQDDVVFFNVQGFVMQLLGDNMPGLFSIDTPSSADSDVLQYSRHEFNTYFLQHAEHQDHAVDPSDANWHLDNTPHIDHDHLVVAFAGHLSDGSLPIPGATPSFDLMLHSFTLFEHGLAGDFLVDINDMSNVQGNVLSNGEVEVSTDVVVDGDATGAVLDIQGSATVTGTLTQSTDPITFMPVDIPTTLDNLGLFEVKNSDTITLDGGSYRMTKLMISSDATLVVNNVDGPVTLYVTQLVDVAGSIVALDPNPEKFAIYVSAGGQVKLKNYGTFDGVVYAPGAYVDISGGGQFYGAFVGDIVKISDHPSVTYDAALASGGVLPGGSDSSSANNSDSSGGTDAGGSDAGETGSDNAAPAADTVTLTKAVYKNGKTKLVIFATSDVAPDAQLTISIDGFVANAPMTYKANKGRYEYKAATSINLDGYPVSVSSDQGGSASGVIQ